MALSSTIHHFNIELADIDRGVYESLELRVARHPSEAEDYLLTRVLAYCLEYTEGISFSAGLSEPNTPPIAVRDLTGALTVWIDIGAPDSARLHKASKATPRVVVYTHKAPALLLKSLAGEKIHRAEKLELYAIDRQLLSALATHVDRRTAFALTVQDGALMIAFGDTSLTGTVERLLLAATG